MNTRGTSVPRDPFRKSYADAAQAAGVALLLDELVLAGVLAPEVEEPLPEDDDESLDDEDAAAPPAVFEAPTVLLDDERLSVR
jgi:hypothetical protein